MKLLERLRKPQTPMIEMADANLTWEAWDSDTECWWLSGMWVDFVSGEQHRSREIQAALVPLLPKSGSSRANVAVPIKVSLRREPANPHDSNAIGCFYNETLCGYVPAAIASVIAPVVDGAEVESWDVPGVARGNATSTNPSLNIGLALDRRFSRGPDLTAFMRSEDWITDAQKSFIEGLLDEIEHPHEAAVAVRSTKLRSLSKLQASLTIDRLKRARWEFDPDEADGDE